MIARVRGSPHVGNWHPSDASARIERVRSLVLSGRAKMSTNRYDRPRREPREDWSVSSPVVTTAVYLSPGSARDRRVMSHATPDRRQGKNFRSVMRFTLCFFGD